MRMPRTGNIQLARIFGIRVGVSVSWFVVLFFFIFVLSGNFRDILGSDSQAYAVAVASSLLFFASLLMHELGHALMARRAGIQIDGIDLWMLGGVARMRSVPQTPGDELRIAAAGPLVTLAVVAICIGIGAASSGLQHFADVAVLTNGVHATPGLVLLSWLATINALVFVFNLIPAYPLDGGQIAHALAWRATGDATRATRATGQIGRTFGLGLIGLGIAGLAGGNQFLNGWFAGVAGLWALMIGFFISQAARGVLLQARVSERMRDVRVADIMDRDPLTIPGATTMLDAHDQYFSAHQWPWFAVVDDQRHFLGALSQDRVEAELRDGRPALTAAEVADNDPPLRIDVSATLESLLGSEGLRRLGAVVAVDAEGLLCGVVTLAQVRRALTPSAGV